jgi:hypothetical protein
MTKAQEVFQKVEALTATGMTKALAFKQLAEEYGQPVDSLRGAYYSVSRTSGESRSRPRRRETTPEDALADARTALERAIESIDREVEVAEERAQEATAEAKKVFQNEGLGLAVLNLWGVSPRIGGRGGAFSIRDQ